VVAVGAEAMLRGTVLHAANAGRRTRRAARRRRPACHTACLPTGMNSSLLLLPTLIPVSRVFFML
jgi:hypothetical protein